MSVHVLPDVEALVIDWALATEPVASLVSDRIYSALPSNPTFPCVRIIRIGGAPTSRPLWLDNPLLQVDVWGGPKSTTRLIAETIRAHMADSLPGGHTLGWVTSVEFGQFSWLPDASYDPAKPRYSFDVSLYLHP